MTAKQYTFANGNDLETKKTYFCNCKKKYSTKSGLWKHKKICSNNIEEKKEDPTDKELIMLLIKQNAELLELVKNGTQNTTIHNSNNNNNSHNKTFNLQFFLHLFSFKTPILNEKRCKTPS